MAKILLKTHILIKITYMAENKIVANRQLLFLFEKKILNSFQ